MWNAPRQRVNQALRIYHVFVNIASSTVSSLISLSPDVHNTRSVDVCSRRIVPTVTQRSQVHLIYECTLNKKGVFILSLFLFSYSSESLKVTVSGGSHVPFLWRSSVRLSYCEKHKTEATKFNFLFFLHVGISWKRKGQCKCDKNKIFARELCIRNKILPRGRFRPN